MATDRLRRRLRDVDAGELADLTESFCYIGTPLPDLNDRKKDHNELKPIWQQEARDAQGRRRFHGAFTGGFSAGYFNTVGSKEGWTASSFRSSRADKQAGKQPQQNTGSRPEDFMDEEDLEDWKAAQQVSTSSAFGETKHDDRLVAGLRQAGGSAGDALASSLFGELGLSHNETQGFKLLRRMGWKEGQGLGPRVNAEKKARLLSLISSSGGSAVATSSQVTLEDMQHMYAPPPTSLLALTAVSRRSRRGLGAENKPTLQETLASSRKPAARAAGISSGTPSSEDTWPDGRPILSGFHLASEPLPPEASFPAQPLPPDWQPDPSRVWKRHASNSGSQSAQSQATSTSPASRGQLLGEARIPGPPPSIAAFLSAKALERLAADSSASLAAAPATYPTIEHVEVPRLDVATARQALQGFAPFAADPAIQDRYSNYLRGQVDASSEEARQLPVPPHMTAEQFSNELREFSKSAAIFRPMSSAIASRFTTASASVMAHETSATSATPGLRQPAPPSKSTEEDESKSSGHEPVKELSEAQKAAQMDNFGHLTRKVEAWAPERLLCKRFGVPEPPITRKQRGEDQDRRQSHSKAARPDAEDESDPFYGSSRTSKSKSANVRVDQHWERNKEQLKALAAGPTPLALEAGAASPIPPTANTESESGEGEVGLGDDERQGRETLTYVKPSADVFKAIFASDEEDSDPDDTASTKVNNEAGTRAVTMHPKMQDPASGSGVLFQARSKRKDADTDTEKPTSKPPTTKRKKDKSSKASSKSLLTFDLDDGDHESSTPQSTETASKNKSKARIRASDMF